MTQSESPLSKDQRSSAKSFEQLCRETNGVFNQQAIKKRSLLLKNNIIDLTKTQNLNTKTTTNTFVFTGRKRIKNYFHQTSPVVIDITKQNSPVNQRVTKDQEGLLKRLMTETEPIALNDECSTTKCIQQILPHIIDLTESTSPFSQETKNSSSETNSFQQPSQPVINLNEQKTKSRSSSLVPRKSTISLHETIQQNVNTYTQEEPISESQASSLDEKHNNETSYLPTMETYLAPRILTEHQQDLHGKPNLFGTILLKSTFTM